MSKSKVEQYIEKAVKAAHEEFSGTRFSDVNIQMHMEADGATKALAEALLQQAKANAQTSEAMMQLAKSLKPTDACAIRITNDKLQQ